MLFDFLVCWHAVWLVVLLARCLVGRFVRMLFVCLVGLLTCCLVGFVRMLFGCLVCWDVV